MTKNEKKAGCVFCQALAQADGLENLIVARGKRSFAILNLYPYTSGHLMVLPLEHIATLEDLTPETRFELMEQTTYAMTVLRDVYQPQGFNVGINIGEAAGAGIVDHVHIHIVPRWSGDTNFLSTVAETRMIPESPEDSYRRIRHAWQSTIETVLPPVQIAVTGRK
jgi:ATP adenylyltransferase